MSQASEVASTAVQLDWKLIAAAAATFVATLIITILGWWNGRKKVAAKIEDSGTTVTGAILLDNLTIREATAVNREVRDRLLIHCEALHSNTKTLEHHVGSMDDILEELKAIRKILERG
jgi:hypothetical protein